MHVIHPEYQTLITSTSYVVICYMLGVRGPKKIVVLYRGPFLGKHGCFLGFKCNKHKFVQRVAKVNIYCLAFAKNVFKLVFACLVLSLHVLSCHGLSRVVLSCLIFGYIGIYVLGRACRCMLSGLVCFQAAQIYRSGRFLEWGFSPSLCNAYKQVWR